MTIRVPTAADQRKAEKELRAAAAKGRELIKELDASPFPKVAPGTSRKIRRLIWKFIRAGEALAS